jgi:hypothetical protein
MRPAHKAGLLFPKTRRKLVKKTLDRKMKRVYNCIKSENNNQQEKPKMQKVSLVKRVGKFYDNSRHAIQNAAEAKAEESGHKLVAVEKHPGWAYTAEYEDGSVGVIVRLEEKGEVEMDVIFGYGQMIGSKGYVVEKDEYYDGLGIGN